MVLSQGNKGVCFEFSQNENSVVLVSSTGPPFSRKLLSLILIFLLYFTGASGQIWQEDFSGLANGTTIDNGATAWSISLGGALGSGGYFEVRSNTFESYFLASYEDVWISESIDISAYSAVQIDVDIFENPSFGGLDPPDYIRGTYQLDGETETEFFIQYDNFSPTTKSIYNLSGTSLVIRIYIYNTGNDEGQAFDNVTVSEFSPTDYYSIADGTYDDPTIWSLSSGGPTCNCVPTSTGNVHIENSYTVDIDADADAFNLTVYNGGTLRWITDNNTLNIYGSLSVESGAIVNENSTAGAEIAFPGSSFGRSFDNDGTFNIGILNFQNSSNSISIGGSAEIVVSSGFRITSDNSTIINNNTGGININGGFTDLVFNCDNSTFINNTLFSTSDDVFLEVTNSDYNTIINNAGATFNIQDDLRPNNSIFTFENYGTVNMNGDFASGEYALNEVNIYNYSPGEWNWEGTVFDTDLNLFCNYDSNTFNYSRTGAQTIIPPDDAYWNLTFSGSGSKSSSSADLDVNGNLTISESASLDVNTNNIDIYLAGNWTNTSIAATPFNYGTENVYLDGSSAQSISNTNNETFYNLIISNTSTGITLLDGDVIVSNQLTMTTGNITTGSNKITLGTSAAITGSLSHVSGTIIGQFERWLNTLTFDYLFPIGTATNYRPAIVNFTYLTNGSLIGEFISTDPGNSGLPLDDGGICVTRTHPQGYWSMVPANSMASNNFTLKLTGNGFNSYTTPFLAGTRIATRLGSGNDWTLPGDHVIATGFTAFRNSLNTTDGPEYAIADIEDVVDPSISCPVSGQQDVTTNSACTYVHSGTTWDANATDNCNVNTIEYALTGATTGTGTSLDGIAFEVGTTTVTWTATDDASNTDVCSFTVDVTDNVDPTITCAADQSQTADAGQCDAAVTVVAPATSDNCGVATVTNDFNGTADASDTYPVGTTTVTWTVTDIHGNTNTCTQDITVTDDEDPSITCAADQSQTADAGQCDAAVTVTGPVTADNCGVAAVTNDFNGTADASDTYPVGTTTVTWTVTDIHGNTNTCTQDITVTDDEDPSITCAADQSQTADAGQCDAAVTIVAPATSDNCGVATVTNDFNGTADASDTYPVGTTTVTWTVTDIHGNTNTCTQDITVTDDEDPSITCAADQSQTADAGQCDAAVTVVAPATSDNCGVATVTNDFNGTADASDTYPVGTTTVTWTVTDIHGNTNTCTQDITVTDDEDPIAICNDIDLYLDVSGLASISITDINNGSSDNCGIDSMSLDITDFNCDDIGPNNVTLTVFDIHGNIGTCIANVNVIDTIAPVAICKDVDIYLDSTGNASITALDVYAGDNEACSIDTMTVDISDFTCGDIGPNTVILTVFDNSSNFSSCSATVNVFDTITPNFTVPADITICGSLDCVYDTEIVPAITGDVTDEWDNCNINEATYVDNFDNLPACDQFGYITRTWTLADDHGNNISKDQVIYIDPFPKVTLNTQNDTLCSTATTNITINSITLSEHPVKLKYSVIPDNPADVDISINGSTTGLDDGYMIADNIENLSFDTQRILFVVTPYTVDGTGAERCTGNNDTVIIFIQPFPQITVSVDRDTICADETINFSITNNNGTYFGTWLYDVDVVEEVAGAITGFDVLSGVSDPVQSDNLVNNTADVHWIEYIFKPRIVGGSSDDANCQRQQQWDTVRIYVQPFPQITVSVDRDTICADETINFSITNDNGTYFGTWLYDVDVVEEVAGAITGFDVLSGVSDPVQSDNLVNNTADVHWIEYIFKPRIVGGSSDDANCQRQQQWDTVRIYVQPFPQITVAVDRDTICADETINFSITNDNGTYFGTWLYDVDVVEEVAGAITGFDVLSGVSDPVQSDNLVNNTADVHWIEYIFKPRIVGGSSDDANCQRQQQWDTVRIYVQPFPQITVAVDRDTICADETINFSITNDNGTYFGTWLYDVDVVEEVAGAITGFDVLSGVSDPVQSDNLVNNTADVHWIEYIFKPRIVGGSSDDANCQRQQEWDTVRIYINPNARIILTYAPDTILCDEDTITFTASTGNGTIIGEWVYDVSFIASDISAIQGINGAFDTTTANFTQYLRNTSDTLQWIDYTFSPKIKGVSSQVAYCGNGIDQTIRVWLNPVPHLQVTISDTIYCDTSTIHFTVENINGTVYGTKVFDVVVEYLVGGITNTYTPSETNLESPVDIFDDLINNTDSLQLIKYIFIPKIYNPGGKDPAKYCDKNGIIDTVTIYLNPTPRLSAVLITETLDTVVCDTADYEITLISENGTIIGDKVYILDSESTGDVSGVIPDGAYALDDIISNVLVNNTKHLQIVTYNIKPVFRNVNGFDPDCDKGIDTTIIIYLNPTPVFDSITISDTVICNESYVVITPYNSQITTGEVKYEFFTESSFVTGIKNNAGGPFIIEPFTDTLVNSSDTIQAVEYNFLPVIDDQIRGILCSNGRRDSVVVKVTPTLLDTASRRTYIGDWGVRCFGESNGRIDLHPYGGYEVLGYNYQWFRNGTDLNKDSVTIDNIIAGEYVYRIEDIIGCFYIDTIQITQPDPMIFSDTSIAVSCDGAFDGKLIVLTSGGTPVYSYYWEGPIFNYTDPDSIVNIYAGNYDVTVTDINGCIRNELYVVDAPESVVITPVFSKYGDYNTSCYSSSDGYIHIEVYGQGSSYDDYTFEWLDENGITISTLRNLDNVPDGFYQITAIDSIGCMKTEPYVITQPPPIFINRTGKTYPGNFDISCFGFSDGEVSLDISGSHTYRGNLGFEWTKTPDDGYFEITRDINGLIAGTYNLTVTDTFNCTADTSFILVEPDEILVTLVDSSEYTGFDISCKSFSDGSLDPVASGGYGDFTYHWSSLDGTVNQPDEQNLRNATAGTYTLTATDSISCQMSWDFTLVEPDTLDINPLISDYNGFNITCTDSLTGSITLNPAGGTGIYSFSWSGDSPGLVIDSENQSGLNAGTYTVELLDQNNCFATWDILLTQPEPLMSQLDSFPIACYGANTGHITQIVTGGVPSYSFLWSNGETSQDIYNLVVGEYSVIVTDANNCITYDTTIVPESPEILIGFDAPLKFNGRMISCYGASDADLYSMVEGGIGGYSYDWINTGDITADLMNIPAGKYYLKVTDELECSVIDSFEIVQPPHITTEVFPTDPTCYRYTDGYITVIPQGGTPAYNILWGGIEQTGQEADSLGAGVYNVSIIDLNNCRLDTTAQLFEPDSLYIIKNIVNPYCPDKPDGEIDVSITGGTEPYSVTWINSEHEGQYLRDLLVGSYVVEIVDNNLCLFRDTTVLEGMHISCLRIPTAFTPNADGYNDTWEIELIDLYPEVIIEIYNRWGTLIYVSDKGYTNPWDGTYNGRDLPIDSYHYVILPGKGRKPITGNVTIIR